MAGIQNSHTVEIKGSTPMPLRTGYDTIIAHRCDKKFAVVSKDDGKVIEVSNKHIAVKYNDGSVNKYKVGLNYGVSNGTVINNTLVTDFKVGDTFTKGTVLAYHPKHFQHDVLDKSQVLYKHSAVVRTLFMDSNDTEEDSSAISQRLSDAMEMGTTEIRVLQIPFSSEVRDLVEVGSEVSFESKLCILVDGVLAENSMFSEDELEGLSQLTQATPRAKHEGMISKIEVLYLGDPEKASPSVKAIIAKYNKERMTEAAIFNDGRPNTGELLETINIDGTKLPVEHMAIKFYIASSDPMGIGDKCVVK